MAKCPICKREVPPRAENPWFPFDSQRCKLIDLGKWLDEAYRVPGKVEEEEDEEQPDIPGESDGEGDA